MSKTPIQSIYASVTSGDVALTKRLLHQHPECLKQGISLGTWLDLAARVGRLGIAGLLLELGLDVNSCKMPEEGTPLISAIHGAQLNMARYLLSRGANPNVGRTLIAAINVEPDELALEFVKLLVEHGADINRSFPWFGDDKLSFTPLSWAEMKEKKAIVAYLRSTTGAPAQAKKPEKKTTPKTLADEVVAYIEKEFGPVQPQALIEIVPTALPVAIHLVRPGNGRNHLTLFTTGMSERAMTVPKGNEEYRFAELFIQLPADWPLTKKGLSDPNYGWPVEWLRSIAKYPHENGSWLGGPVTIIANGEPPGRLAPKINFTSFLLMAEKDFISQSGNTIQLYRVTPLYTEERELEIKHGVAALVRAFDKFDVPFVVDLNRRNIAIGFPGRKK